MDVVVRIVPDLLGNFRGSEADALLVGHGGSGEIVFILRSKLQAHFLASKMVLLM